MKRILLVPVLLGVLALGGCTTFEKIGNTIAAVTTTIKNPVGQVEIVRAKNVYAGTLELAVEYRNYCWSRPYAELMTNPVSRTLCENRRSVVRNIQFYRPRVAAAITTAENFVRNNPTINAGSALSAMWAAVEGFQKLIPRGN